MLESSLTLAEGRQPVGCLQVLEAEGLGEVRGWWSDGADAELCGM